MLAEEPVTRTIKRNESAADCILVNKGVTSHVIDVWIEKRDREGVDTGVFCVPVREQCYVRL